MATTNFVINDLFTFFSGVDPPVPAKTRFHVIRWQYFTEFHIYMVDDFHNMEALTGELYCGIVVLHSTKHKNVDSCTNAI